jgi:hypothetical protein
VCLKRYAELKVTDLSENGALLKNRPENILARVYTGLGQRDEMYCVRIKRYGSRFAVTIPCHLTAFGQDSAIGRIAGTIRDPPIKRPAICQSIVKGSERVKSTIGER